MHADGMNCGRSLVPKAVSLGTSLNKIDSSSHDSLVVDSAENIRNGRYQIRIIERTKSKRENEVLLDGEVVRANVNLVETRQLPRSWKARIEPPLTGVWASQDDTAGHGWQHHFLVPALFLHFSDGRHVACWSCSATHRPPIHAELNLSLFHIHSVNDVSQGCAHSHAR